MEYYYSGVEPSPALTSALIEIRLVQRRRLKTKMTDKITIGDCEATIISANLSKTYNGTATIVKIENEFHIELRSDGKREVILPCEKIINCSMMKTIVTLQVEEDFQWEKCIFTFYSEAQAEVFQSKLPPIKRPIDHNSTESSDTNFDDYGNEKTEAFKENLFNSDNPLDELEEL